MLDTNFLVTTILVVIALLFYTLYWSRSIAFLISLLLRVVFWNRGGSSVWIQIGAFTPVSLPCLLHLPDACVRLFSHLTSGRPDFSQGFSLPLEQPDVQNRQS
jgi:hypothetical protein